MEDAGGAHSVLNSGFPQLCSQHRIKEAARLFDLGGAANNVGQSKCGSRLIYVGEHFAEECLVLVRGGSKSRPSHIVAEWQRRQQLMCAALQNVMDFLTHQFI